MIPRIGGNWRLSVCLCCVSLGLTLLYLNAYNALGQIPPTYGYGYGNSVTVQFASSSYTVNENAGTAALTLTLNAAAANTVTVNYATSDGTAIAGTDYVATSGTVTFNPGVTSQTINLGIIDNGSDTNQSVQFAVTMSQPSSNAALGTPSTTTVNIVTVTVPAGFAQGQWNFVQIVKPGNTRTLGGGTRQQGNNYGEWVLDTTYPYEPAPYRSYPTPGEPAGSYATGNTPHTVTDTPATFLLPATLRDTGMKNQQWEMYVMFLPPGVDGRYVPLKKIAWNVNCNVTNGAGGWNISAGATQNAGDATITSVHPQWTANVVKPFKWVKAP
jgi:hypothetical protein